MLFPSLSRAYPVALYIAPMAVALLTAGCDRLESLDSSWLLVTRHHPREPQAGQWSGHRGAMLQGVSADDSLPVHFAPGVNTRWVVALPGTGNSSPTVIGDCVFLTLLCQGDPPELAVLCWNRLSGQLQWEQRLGPPAGRTHSKNGHASATVATDGERVYATFGSRGVFCFSMDGQLLWNTPLETLDHPWGHASSPVLAGDLVIQLADGSHGSVLLALNCHTGEIVWATERESTGSWTTPALVPVTRDGQRHWEIVVNGTGSTNGTAGYVIAYDPGTGEELWRVRGTTDIPCPTAIVGESLVVSTSGKNGPIIAIRPGGIGDVSDSHVAWRLPWGGPSVPTGVIKNGRLYLISDGGIMRCLDVAQGHTLWEKRLHRGYSASLVAGGDKIYAVSEGGDVHVLAASDRYEPLGVNHLRERCLATPAIAYGDLLLRTEQHLYCFGNSPTSESSGLVQQPAADRSATSAETEAADAEIFVSQ